MAIPCRVMVTVGRPGIGVVALPVIDSTLFRIVSVMDGSAPGGPSGVATSWSHTALQPMVQVVDWPCPQVVLPTLVSKVLPVDPIVSSFHLVDSSPSLDSLDPMRWEAGLQLQGSRPKLVVYQARGRRSTSDRVISGFSPCVEAFSLPSAVEDLTLGVGSLCSDLPIHASPVVEVDGGIASDFSGMRLDTFCVSVSAASSIPAAAASSLLSAAVIPFSPASPASVSREE